VNHGLIPRELQIGAVGVLLAFLAWVLHLVRSNRFSLRDGLPWISSTLGVLLLTLFPGLLRTLATALRIEVPSNALFALAILYLGVNVLSAAIALSSSAARVRRLAQECALLRGEIEQLRRELEQTRGAAVEVS
jgi:hypothetical protein